MYETLEHWKQYKQKKYQQCPAEKPGAMVLDEMIEAEEQAKELFNEWGFQYKEKAKQNVSDNSHKLVTEYDKESFDRWMSDLIKRNGTTKYQNMKQNKELIAFLVAYYYTILVVVITRVVSQI